MCVFTASSRSKSIQVFLKSAKYQFTVSYLSVNYPTDKIVRVRGMRGEQYDWKYPHQEIIIYPILDTRISVLLLLLRSGSGVRFRLPPQDFEMDWNGDFW